MQDREGVGGSVSGKPYPKAVQLARSERRYVRKVASPKRWQQIADAKQGPCRATGAPPPNDLAHIIPRSEGGPDSEWNIVPLAREPHRLFDARDPETCRKVLASLTDHEYAGLIKFGGEGVFERRFRIRFEDVA